jgi:signal transduction histidine kinase
MTLRRPKPTIRLRLTLVYGGLFLACGTVLLAITYVLVRQQYTGQFFISSGKQGVAGIIDGHRHGTSGPVTTITGTPGVSPGKAPNPAEIAAAARAQSTAALHQLLVDSGIALAVMAVFSIWLGWLIAGRALSPLRSITNAAREISARSLHRRLVLGGPDDELKQLATTFNELLARLEAAFEAQRRFVANASHELRTPLTLERALLELALSDPNADVASLRQTCEKLLAVGKEQERLIEALLTLSRSQRGLEQRDPVDLATIAATAATAADRNGLALQTSLRPARTVGDERLIERLIANLVDNAIKHNVSGGNVRVATGTTRGRAFLRITNSGQPVQPHELSRLLEPFERLDREHSVKENGLGLGLSIVDAIAKAHDAELTAKTRPEGGLEIEVAFPLSAKVQAAVRST